MQKANAELRLQLASMPAVEAPLPPPVPPQKPITLKKRRGPSTSRPKIALSTLEVVHEQDEAYKFLVTDDMESYDFLVTEDDFSNCSTCVGSPCESTDQSITSCTDSRASTFEPGSPPSCLTRADTDSPSESGDSNVPTRVSKRWRAFDRVKACVTHTRSLSA